MGTRVRLWGSIAMLSLVAPVTARSQALARPKGVPQNDRWVSSCSPRSLLGANLDCMPLKVWRSSSWLRHCGPPVGERHRSGT